ncbi:DUF4157 domain-containing protein [Actinoplanes sp. NPDC049681]|uniref:eCIS core domain-containing protein n=1 Tax=Actinoplanes sp. NPDC049681 TaxID=3363905 RepID=UPI00379C66BF
MKLSTRQEPQTDGQAPEPVHAVARSPRTPHPSALARTMPAAAGGNAAIQRLATGPAPHPANLGLLSAGGSRALHRLHARTAPVQPRLTVSQPGDRFEVQAEAVAARVGPGEAPAGPAPTITRLATASGAPGDPSGPPGLEALLADPGPGSAIPPEIRARIEPHLGFDLGGVQVHGNDKAQAASAQLGARAFTSGGHIFLGAGESATDLALMAHEATHVVQQQSVAVYRLQRSSDSLLPDFIMEGIEELARSVPGYDMLTVVAGYDPIANRTVDRSPENLVRGVMDLVPFGTIVASKLLELGILQDAFRMIDAGLTANNLTLARIQGDIDRAWAEISIDKGIDGNVAVITRYVDSLYNDALAFVRGIIDQVVQLIRDAAVGLAETYLVGTPLWDLTKKVLHHDPLRGTPVTAPTVEILADFLRLIGKEQTVAQMTERGTLQKTADWLDVQIPRFLGLIGELAALFEAGWNAIQPATIASLADNLSKLARDAVGLVQRVGAFANDIIVTVLRLIKDALLDWLSREAAGMRGYRLMTVILGQDPVTGKAVPRSAENLIGGFIALLPGGEETYSKLAEAGVIAEAGAQIEAAIGRLGISLDMIVGTFKAVWDSLTLEDLLNPIGAFMRVLDKFGEPLGRIVAFAGEVLKVVITLILKLMNFPSELLGSIISNAMAAIEDIERDPVGFLLNMIAALKSGFMSFLDKVLDYLLSGLADWLFRGLGALGIRKPPDLTFKSILELVLQVLDVTVDKLWARLGKHLGDDVVQKIRAGIGMAGEAFDFIKDVQENGVGAVWKHIESQLGNLWDTLLGMAKDWIVSTIIEKATAKLLSMLDPTGIMAVVNSGIAFFNAVQSVIEYVREILAIVNDYVSTLAAVAAGNISAGAAKVERGLANAIPVAIGFLANQAGLGNVPQKLVELIGQLRELVDKALDWLFEQAVRLGKAALNALGIGKPDSAPDDPAAAGFTVHESLKTPDEEDHELYNKPGTFELIEASDNPTSLANHPDTAVQKAYKLYLDAVAAASPSGRKEAAAGPLKDVIEAVRNSTGMGDPQASAPGLGDTGLHGNKPSSLRNTHRLWWLESEHILPFATGRALWNALDLYLPSRGFPEDMKQTTIMIYYGAARLKTPQDNEVSQLFKTSVASLNIRQDLDVATVRMEAGVTDAITDGRAVLDRIERPLQEASADASDRTVKAIEAENKEKLPKAKRENGERRGRKDTREQPLPTAADVMAAATQQWKDLMALARAELLHKEEVRERLRKKGFVLVD